MIVFCSFLSREYVWGVPPLAPLRKVLQSKEVSTGTIELEAFDESYLLY